MFNIFSWLCGSVQTFQDFFRFWLPRQFLLHCSIKSRPCDYASLYRLYPYSRPDIA